MATGRVPTTANSPLTAKGDLFTYSTAPARLAVGNSGEQIVADSSTSTGLRYQTGYNGNAVINGGMDIWQRGTSFTSFASTSVFTSDRYYNFRSSLAAGMTVSRQNTSDTTNLPTIQYCMRIARDSGNTGTTNLNMRSDLETSTSYRFAGQTVVFSYYARAGADYSATSNALSFQLITGTGTDQSIRTGYTNQTNIINTTNTLSTTWQRFTHTVTVGTSATQIGFSFFWTPVGTAGAADYVEITGIQLELGSVPSVFKRSGSGGGTIQGELAACQRYYFLLASGTSRMVGSANAFSATQVGIVANLPVQMRTDPTVVATSGTDYYSFYRNGGSDLFNSVTLGTPNGTVVELYNNSQISSTAGNAGICLTNNASASIAFSAEL